MNNLISGLHHVTALAAHPQNNVDFYTGILGLRLVKKTVNFDAPDIYHLYYGDEKGNPGSIITFFPFSGLRRGKHGNGQMTVTAFSIPQGSMDYWQKRLTSFNINYNQPEERLDDEIFIYLQDNDGLGLELVEMKDDFRGGYGGGPVPEEFAIKGFHSARLLVNDKKATTDVLQNVLNYEPIYEKNNRTRFSVPGIQTQFVDVVSGTDRGMSGSGTVHHLAFATANDADQLEIREKIENSGLQVTPVLDRQYFHSIYFREPGGILFEVATNPPGFSVDEPLEDLGTNLKLPEWLETQRKQLETKLFPLNIEPLKFKK